MELYVNHAAGGCLTLRASREAVLREEAEDSDNDMPEYENVVVPCKDELPPPTRPPPAPPGPGALPKPVPNTRCGRVQGATLALALLLAACFLMWLMLLSLGLVKYAELSAELRRTNTSLWERITQEKKLVMDLQQINISLWEKITQVSQDLKKTQKGQARLQGELEKTRRDVAKPTQKP